MKILHISDVHWRAQARHSEFMYAFEELFYKLRTNPKLKPDLIVNCGDFYHTKTSSISPEVVKRMSWCFKELASIAPTFSILGNHDGAIHSTTRDNIISSIHKVIDDKNLVLYEKSGNYVPEQFGNICFNVFSPFDQKNWHVVQPQEGKINIALFHGAVKSAKTDLGWVLETYEASVVDFTKFDFCLLGDIHKQQFLSYRLDKKGEEKPWIGYPGSFIQLNHGEDEIKGVLSWDIKSRNEWDVDFVEIPNKQPFITIPWINNPHETIQGIVDLRVNQLGKQDAFLPGTRYRVSSSVDIPLLQKKQLVFELKDHYKASEVVFKYENNNKHGIDDIQTTDGVHLSKKRLRNNPEAIVGLYKQFIENNKEQNPLTKKQIEKASKEIVRYISKLNELEESPAEVGIDKTVVPWSINSIEFENLFKYGSDNSITFDNKEGLVGIFGNNRVGKSSSIAAILYALFNTSDRGSLRGSDIINQNKESCSAEAMIQVAAKNYIIKRSTTRSKRDANKSSTKVELFEYDKTTGVTKNINEDSRCDTDKQIRQLIGSPEDFFLTTLAAQSDLNRFISEGSTKRKKYLSKFLEIDIFEKLYDFAKTDALQHSIIMNNKGKGVMSEQEFDRQIQQHADYITEIEKKIDALNNTRDSLREERDNLNIWIRTHETNAIDNDKVANKYKRIEADIASAEKALAAHKTSLNKHNAALVDVQNKIKETKDYLSSVDLEKISNEHQNYIKLRDSIRELKYKFQLENEHLKSQKKTIHKLDLVPCGDSYPDCHYIQDAHKDKLLIDEQKKIVKDIEKQLSELRDFDEKQLKTFEKGIQDYKTCEVNLALYQSNENNIKETIKRTQIEISSCEKDLTILARDLEVARKAMDTTITEEYKGKRVLLQEVTKKISKTDEEKQNLLIDLGAARSKTAKLSEDKSKYKEQINRVRIYSSIQNAFSKTGIPSIILKTQLPAINAELSKILSSIADFKIELEADDNSNAMDVFLIDSNCKRIIELCSGMEKTICSIALRVALINLSSLPRPDMFIMDEPFGALDEDNQQRCLELMETLKQYFRLILIISHETPIKEIADYILEIQNDGIESKIKA